MSSDNYYVIRKHPHGGYTYVTGFESDPRNVGEEIFIDIPAKPDDIMWLTYDNALQAALEDYSEYGVVTHPECNTEEKIRAEITD